jgi:hypothetical protein
MTFINDLIRRAKDRPSELVIPITKLGSVAEHILAQPDTWPFTRPKLLSELKAGKITLLGVPLRVVGS